jgi:hypothetical protein
MNDDLYKLEAIAQRYDNDYNMFLQRNRELKKYKELIELNASEFQALKDMLRRNSINFSEKANTISFAGSIGLDKLSDVLNFLSITKGLKVNTLEFKSQSELPLLIGEGEVPDVYINRMEIEQIKINDQVLGG